MNPSQPISNTLVATCMYPNITTNSICPGQKLSVNARECSPRKLITTMRHSRRTLAALERRCCWSQPLLSLLVPLIAPLIAPLLYSTGRDQISMSKAPHLPPRDDRSAMRPPSSRPSSSSLDPLIAPPPLAKPDRDTVGMQDKLPSSGTKTLRQRGGHHRIANYLSVSSGIQRGGTTDSKFDLHC